MRSPSLLVGFGFALLVSLMACGDDSRPTTDAGYDSGVVPDGGPDCGAPFEPPYALFGPCRTDEDCPEPGDICRTAAEDGWSGGFCTRTCVPPDRGPCDDGVIYNHCAEEPDAGVAYCEQRCLNGLDCMREGYTCVGVGSFSPDSGACVPVCSSDEQCGPSLLCGGNAQCNLWNGRCVLAGEVPTTGVHGDSCADDVDCRSEACLQELSPGGVPTGWNGGYCFGPCIMPAGYNTNTFFDGPELPRGTCPEGDVCFPNGSYTRGDLGACLLGCTTDDDCRAAEAYECLKSFDLPSGERSVYSNGVCFPINCNTTPCPTGFTCRTIPTTAGNRYVCERT